MHRAGLGGPFVAEGSMYCLSVCVQLSKSFLIFGLIYFQRSPV